MPLKPYKPVSKSKYLSLLQCPKLFWTRLNDPDQIPSQDNSGQDDRFDVGFEVENHARQLFPQGVSIDHEGSFSDTIARSKEALQDAKPNVPIYNALITAPGLIGLICEVDILLPKKDGFHLYEVKSSTGMRDHHPIEIAFQKHVCQQAELKISKSHLVTINSDYVRQGDINPKKLFTVQEMDELAEPLFKAIPRNLKAAGSLLDDECPDTAIGCHCSSPYECPLMPVCWKKVLSKNDNIFTLTGLRSEKKWGLFNEGVLRTSQIPKDYMLNNKQEIQVRVDKQGKPHIDPKAIQGFCNQLQYPLYYLDFESFNPAIPMFDGTSPYQQIPFQFSLHIKDKPNGKPKHHGWIWDGNGDPREELVERLKGLLGKNGNIIVYNAQFEKMILRQAVKVCSGSDNWLQGILGRFIDLLEPFRAFNYYHPDQHGSASIKVVLPALTGKGYEGMEISNGSEASTEYMRVMFTDEGAKDRANVFKLLEEYCGMDTMGMVEIVRKLRSMS